METTTTKMDTHRSRAKVEQFQQQGLKLRRKTQTFEKRFTHPPETVFYQFCPSRELDWIEGWDCQLVYTTTGVVEKDCIFTTDESNPIGPGLWVFCAYEPNEKLELVRIVKDAMVIHFRINLKDNRDGTSTGTWNLTFTALNESANAMVDAVPDDNPELVRAIDSLEYYLTNGRMMRSAA